MYRNKSEYGGQIKNTKLFRIIQERLRDSKKVIPKITKCQFCAGNKFFFLKNGLVTYYDSTAVGRISNWRVQLWTVIS